MTQPSTPPCMIVELPTIRAAFQKHLEIHATKPRAWENSYHVSCWELARKAFQQGSLPDFLTLYNELRGRWQIFRPMKNPPPAEQVYELLTGVARDWGQRRLTEMGLQDAEGLLGVLDSMAGVKPTGNGPSIVAISKFLHFMNPGLFMIVDRGVIWNSVLARRWLWQQVLDWRKAVEDHLPSLPRTTPGDACDPTSYVAILLWAGELVRKNPEIPAIFAEYVAQHAGPQPGPSGLIHYQASAVEWFLLGLVELVPEGVTLMANGLTRPSAVLGTS